MWLRRHSLLHELYPFLPLRTTHGWIGKPSRADGDRLCNGIYMHCTAHVTKLHFDRHPSGSDCSAFLLQVPPSTIMLRLLSLALCASAALAAPGTTLSKRGFKWNCGKDHCHDYLLQGTDTCYTYCVSGTCTTRGVDCVSEIPLDAIRPLPSRKKKKSRMDQRLMTTVPGSSSWQVAANFASIIA